MGTTIYIESRNQIAARLQGSLNVFLVFCICKPKRIKSHEIGELLRLFLDIHECFWDKLQCSVFFAPINLNSPVALRLKYPYYDIRPWKIISAQHGIFFGKYSNLQERIRVTGVHYPIWIVCPRSWNAYQPCNLLPLPCFCIKIRYPNLPPPLGDKIKQNRRDFFCIFLIVYISSKLFRR